MTGATFVDQKYNDEFSICCSSDVDHSSDCSV